MWGRSRARLGITQGAVSQHLRILREAGLIEAERRGCHIHYRQREGAFLSVRDALEKVLRCDQHRAPGATELLTGRTQVDGQDGKQPTPQPHPCRVDKVPQVPRRQETFMHQQDQQEVIDPALTTGFAQG